MKQFWVRRNGGYPEGPFDARKLQAMAADGTLLPTDEVRPVGGKRWYRADSVRGLTFPANRIPRPKISSGESRPQRVTVKRKQARADEEDPVHWAKSTYRQYKNAYSEYKQAADDDDVTSIKEYKRTCKRCGKMWHSLVSREKRLAFSYKAKSCSAAAFCCHPTESQLASRNAGADESEYVRLRKCPECGSSNYEEQIV